MLLTEKDAQTKWCPKRADPNNSSVPNCCLGSACMAWRWGTPYYTNDVGVTQRGFCGLAGDAPAPDPVVVHYRGEDAE